LYRLAPLIKAGDDLGTDVRLLRVPVESPSDIYAERNAVPQVVEADDRLRIGPRLRGLSFQRALAQCPTRGTLTDHVAETPE
jgi:hypothetical protein